VKPRYLLAAAAAALLVAAPADALVKTGVTLGLNFASLGDVEVTDQETTYDSRTGWHAGVFAAGDLGPVGVRAGLLYVDAGSLFDGLADAPGLPDDFDDDFRVRYLSLPVDFQWRFVLPPIRPYLLAGPEFRFDLTSDDAFEENMKGATVAANIGVGLEMGLPLLGVTVTPEIRYVFDLQGITEETLSIGGADFDTDGAYEGSAWQIRLHVGF